MEDKERKALVRGGLSGMFYVGALAAILVLPFADVLIWPRGRVLGNPLCDNPSVFYFVNYFAGQCWRDGHVPLWNPHIMMGLPFLGEGQAAIFHPLSAFFIFLPTGAAYNWAVAACFLLTGLFFYGYLRELELGRRASFCGAVAWNFSSILIARIHAGHLPMLLGFVSMPLVMMLWEGWRRRGGAWRPPAISLAYACLIFAGFPQSTYIVSLFLLVYVLLHSAPSWNSKEGIRKEARALLALGFFILLGVGVGAVQLFPSLDFAAESFRRKSSIEFCGSLSFAPENLVTLLCPGFFGTSLTLEGDTYWGRNFLWEMWMYIGILPLVAAAAGVAGAPRRPRAVLLFCGLLFFAVALGKHTPLFRILYRAAPFFDTFRGPSKFSLVTLFCLVTFSAHGFERWFGESRPGRDEPARTDPTLRYTASAALVLFGILAVLYLTLIPGHATEGSRWQRLIQWRYEQGETLVPIVNYRDSAVLDATAARASGALLRAMTLALLALGVPVLLWRNVRRKYIFLVAAAVLFVDLATFFPPLLYRFDESITRIPSSFVEIIRNGKYPTRYYDALSTGNKAMRYGFSAIDGYSGNALPRYNNFVNRSQNQDLAELQAITMIRALPRVFRILALEYVIVRESDAPAGVRVVVRENNKALCEYPLRSPRAFLAAETQPCAAPQEAFDYVFDRAADPLTKPAVETSDPLPDSAPLDAEETVRIAAFSPNRVELRARTSRPRVLMLNEMFYKDWKATVNGADAEIYPANYLFRGVRLPAGESSVVFRYESPAFRRGLWTSAISLVLMAGIFLILWRKRRPGE